MSKRKGPRVVDLEIDSLGADGFGVAQFERRPVHVKGALPGEVVSARVVRRRHGSWYALPDRWLVRSGAHATPACDAFMRCGGCSMQHLTADAQLALKQQWLVDQLEPQRDYPETEINAFLLQFHEDYATLRREFIACKLMAREDGVYRRTI